MVLLYLATLVGFAFAILLGGMAWHIARRRREDTALTRADTLAAMGEHASALQAYLSAETRWACRTPLENCADKVEELNRLRTAVRGAAKAAATTGWTLAVAELESAVDNLKAFYAQRTQFEWDGRLVKDAALDARLCDLNAALQRARVNLRVQAQNIRGTPYA